jgi:hypothetical protein
LIKKSFIARTLISINNGDWEMIISK